VVALLGTSFHHLLLSVCCRPGAPVVSEGSSRPENALEAPLFRSRVGGSLPSLKWRTALLAREGHLRAHDPRPNLCFTVVVYTIIIALTIVIITVIIIHRNHYYHDHHHDHHSHLRDRGNPCVRYSVRVSGCLSQIHGEDLNTKHAFVPYYAPRLLCAAFCMQKEVKAYLVEMAKASGVPVKFREDAAEELVMEDMERCVLAHLLLSDNVHPLRYVSSVSIVHCDHVVFALETKEGQVRCLTCLPSKLCSLSIRCLLQSPLLLRFA
jgi:hypothetical protein